MWLVYYFEFVAVFFLAIVLVARVLRKRYQPSTTLAWLLAIVLVPFVGIPLYILLGERKINKIIRRKKSLHSRSRAKPEAVECNDIEKLLLRHDAPPSRLNGNLHVVFDGTRAYHGLFDLIDNAKQYIHITLYILQNDEVGREFVERLARKAREGVAVRLLLDAVGSFKTRRAFVQPLRDAGGQVGVFVPLLYFDPRARGHLRNHRKLLVVDGIHGVLGGMNVGKEYIGPAIDKDRWLDCVILFDGPAVGDIHQIFKSDWEFATGEPLEERKYSISEADSSTGDPMRMQVVASGPDVASDPLRDSILYSIVQARDRVWIVTPYFVPDESLEGALSLAARLGRDVRIYLPKRSDNQLMDLVRGSYVRGLMAKGVKVLLYEAGMVHAKTMVIDDCVAVIGSANMDIRSFYLNYEVAAFIYSHPKVAEVAGYVENLGKFCKPYSEPKGLARRFVRNLGEDVCRLFAPLL